MNMLDILYNKCYYRKMDTIFDRERAGNIFPGRDRDNVVLLSEYGVTPDAAELDDELMVFPRTLGIDLDEAEQKRAALIMVGAAAVCVPIAVGTAIANGPLPF